MFDNKEECCGHNFPGVTDCVSNSIAMATGTTAADTTTDAIESDSAVIYYPSSTEPKCLSDGNEPIWLPPDSKFDNKEDCCKKNFPTQDCTGEIAAGNAHKVYYPSSLVPLCLSDGGQPSWLEPMAMFGTPEECCGHNFPGTSNCVGETVEKEKKQLALSATTTTTEPTLAEDSTSSTTSATAAAAQDVEPEIEPLSISRPTEPLPLRPIKTPGPTPSPVRTKRPTRHPTPQPTGHPTERLASNYEMIQTEQGTVMVQTPSPTRKPTRRPRPGRPTIVQEGSLASSFNAVPSDSIVILRPTEPAVVEYPNKGSEFTNYNHNSYNQQQQQQQQMVAKKGKRPGRGKKKGSKGSKATSSKSSKSSKSSNALKRQKKNQKKKMKQQKMKQREKMMKDGRLET